MFELTGKVALVTGGSRGIGRAAAQALARQGAHLVVGYCGNAEAAAETVKSIEGAGGRAEAVQFDVSNMQAADHAISSTSQRLGRLDILVASAGISIDSLLLRLKEEDLDRILAVNLKGAIACAKAAIKSMVRPRQGRVIFLSSVVGEMGNAGQTAYAASKAALLGVTRSLAREYASRNITVNAIAPGYIETDMTGDLTAAQRQAMLAGVPMGRTGTPAEVGALVAYLASDEAGYLTGQSFRINGGMYM